MQHKTTKYQLLKPKTIISNIFKFPRITEVAISNDNAKVVYSTFSLKSNSKEKFWQYQLYLKKPNQTILLIKTKDAIISPQWSADSKKLIYLTKNYAKKSTSIWLYQISNHSTTKLLTLERDIISCKLSPNGKKIAFVTEDIEIEYPINHALPIDLTKYFANVRLYLLSISSFTANKTPIKTLTPVNYSISCELNLNCFDWSPDSKSIAFAYQPMQGLDFVLQSKIGILNLATQKITIIPYTKSHAAINPRFSPDGKWLAYKSNLATATSAHTSSPVIAQNSQICVTNLSTLSRTYVLTNTPNQNPNILGWNKNCSGVFVHDHCKTQGPQIYFLSLDPKTKTQLIERPKGCINEATFSLNAKYSSIGFAFETTNTPPEVFVATIKKNSLQLTQISRLNPLSQTSLGKVATIHWYSRDGKLIEGLLITPPQYHTKKKYPLYVMVHGAPLVWSEHYLGRCEEYGAMFDPSTCVSAILQQGFVVFQPNYRGSIGYGKNFRIGNVGDWGGKDYEDIMSGIDYLVKQRKIDAKRMILAGWSYGAYLTNLAIGRTDRFQLAIAGDGMTNLLSLIGTTDIPKLFKQDFGGDFWENVKLYWERSPLAHVNQMRTSLLLFHGSNDIRVPLSQSRELCQTMMIQKKLVTLLILPNEGHMPANPNTILGAIKAIVERVCCIRQKL